MSKEKVKLTKIDYALTGCAATYEWEDQTIEKDNAPYSGAIGYWYCEPMFKGVQFRTLRGVRKALQMYVDKGRKPLSWYEIHQCEEE